MRRTSRKAPKRWRVLWQWHPERPPLVIGVMRDKNMADIAHALLPVVSSVIATARRRRAPSARAISLAIYARPVRRAVPNLIR